jgi:hypothetical protein
MLDQDFISEFRDSQPSDVLWRIIEDRIALHHVHGALSH